MKHGDQVDRTEEWERYRRDHLKPNDQRPASAAQGVHHLALLSSDVERTICFYQDVLEFPLTEVFENRDYQGSTHFFFDIGNGNSLPSSTSPDSTSVRMPKCSAVCITLLFRWLPTRGTSSSRS